MNEKTAIPDPTYTHDCDNCIYLGSYQPAVPYDLYLSKAGKTLAVPYDLYLCEASKTLVARWGSEGYQYASGLALITHDFAIAAAARRALAYYMGITNYWEV